MPMLPWPVCPLAGHATLGQNVVVGFMLVSSESRWGTYQEEYAWTPIFIASEPYHGYVCSYQNCYLGCKTCRLIISFASRLWCDLSECAYSDEVASLRLGQEHVHSRVVILAHL